MRTMYQLIDGGLILVTAMGKWQMFEKHDPQRLLENLVGK